MASGTSKANKGHENLIPQAHVLTVEEQSAGGKASVEARRNRKRVREVAEVLLSLPISKGDMVEVEQLRTITEDTNTDVITGIICNLIKQALDGDLRAMQILFTMTGDYTTRYNIQADTIVRDKSIERLKESFSYRENFEPMTAEQVQARKEQDDKLSLMFEYLVKYPAHIAGSFSHEDVIHIRELFNTADDDLKVNFVRRCYGKEGHHLKYNDCIALYDNVYLQKIIGAPEGSGRSSD